MKKGLVFAAAIFCFASCMLNVYAENSMLLSSDNTPGEQYDVSENHMDKKTWPEQNWGIGVEVRAARIPFATAESRVMDLIPQLYFSNDYFYIDGLESGLKLWKSDPWEFFLFGELRFFDIPAEYQNRIQEDSLDVGFQFRFEPMEDAFVELEILTDLDFRMQSNFRIGFNIDNGEFQWMPYVNANFKTSRFNNYYFGLNRLDIGGDVDLSAGFEAEYHIYRNFYLTGSFELVRLGEHTYDCDYVNKRYLDRTYIGIKLSNESKDAGDRKPKLGNTPYIRVAHGWGTTSSLAKIIRFQTESDPYNNQLTSIFYGHPLTDELFGFPLDIYLTPGLVWHWSSEVQNTAQEYVIGIKAYYTFKWPFIWRFGVAEGMSYITDVTYVEETDLDRKGYDISKLMNYLDFSLDMNLTELLQLKGDGSWWIGYSIHHRSSIFESASHFGRIGGGSNYNTVYMQYHF